MENAGTYDAVSSQDLVKDGKRQSEKSSRWSPRPFFFFDRERSVMRVYNHRDQCDSLTFPFPRSLPFLWLSSHRLCFSSPPWRSVARTSFRSRPSTPLFRRNPYKSISIYLCRPSSTSRPTVFGSPFVHM